MSKLGCVLFSYLFDQNGLAKKFAPSQYNQESTTNQLSWVHLDFNHKSTANWLRTKIKHVDNLVIKALLDNETRPRVVEFEHGLLIILRGTCREKNPTNEMVSIRLWVDGERIITIQKRPMASIFRLQEQIENENLSIENAGQFLHQLINHTINDISALIYALGNKIDEIEDEVIETRNLKYRQQILGVRSALTIYRRHLIPQKEVFGKIRDCRYYWVDETSTRHFQENCDHVSRVIDEVEEVLSRSKLLHDELSHALSEKISHNTFKLSVVTMIFMPLSFIAGIFGMNFKNIPSLNYEYGFHFTCLGMLIVVVFQLIFIRKGNWF